MDNIEHLYKCYDILSQAGDEIGQHVSEYMDILKAVKGSSKEKRLASQFIGIFFKHFPKLFETAIDAQLDLCEDEDAQIRRQAIKDLPKLCQGTKEATVKVGDTLAQLLVLDDLLELQQVNQSLQTVIKMDAKSALCGVFTQITNGDELTRERCLKFIATKLFTIGPTVINKEVEEYIVDEIKKILQDVTADEFHLCMNILGLTRLGSTVTGHAELVNLAIEQAELNADVDLVSVEDESVERFIQCATHAIPYFSASIKSDVFVTYVCDKLLPLETWNMIITRTQDEDQLRLLKVFAELCTHSGTIENASLRIDNIYNVLKTYMPLPKLLDDDINNPPPSFQFSHTECLLYALHTLGKKNVDSFTFIKNADTLKDFRSRLQYLARGTQGYIRRLQEAVKNKTMEELNSEENQLKLNALKTTSNISVLIRDLFHSPPSFKNNIQLSWIIGKNALKRHITIDFDEQQKNNKDNKKKSKTSSEQTFYTPPSGKYSGKVQNYGNKRSNSRNTGDSVNRNRRDFIKY